jgi:disulfide bond formation protein DsbB
MLGLTSDRNFFMVNSALPYIAWITALLGTVGSLFFSEVMLMPPCVLCWYQRIAMYPLVLIIGIAIATRDSGFRRYALPLSLGGSTIT